MNWKSTKIQRIKALGISLQAQGYLINSISTIISRVVAV